MSKQMMSRKPFYRFDETTFEYTPVHVKNRDKWMYAVIHWSLSVLLITTLGFAALSQFALTPGELALSEENRILIDELTQASQKMTHLEQELLVLREADNELYRSVLGMERLEDEWEMGTGGADVYASYDRLSEDAAAALRTANSTLERLELQADQQARSFREIQTAFEENRERMNHLPAIRPINGILLSGFGVRVHPVYNRQRMHDGVDFRANIGTEIYATGDAVVRSAGRKGTYGNLLILDHDFGYETRYAHLSGFAEGIRSGKKVKRGDLIGYTGNTGLTRGPHLHYEILKDGVPVDPLNYMFADITPEEYLMFREISDRSPVSMD